MKKLILAALLACVPVAANAVIVPNDSDPITTQELKERAMVCAALADGKITPEDVIAVYKLDTQRKQRDFALQCQMLMLGFQVGEASNPKNRV